jgi:hypothetical protein
MWWPLYIGGQATRVCVELGRETFQKEDRILTQKLVLVEHGSTGFKDCFYIRFSNSYMFNRVRAR